jgi:hypothetical protein
MPVDDRRSSRREATRHGRRRYARIHLDVDWMLESESTSTWGKGLDATPRSARLPVSRAIHEPVLLYVALPGRARMFRARGHVVPSRAGLLIRFDEVPAEDLKLLGDCLVQLGGLRALDQKFQRFSDLPRRFLAGST